MTITIGFWFWPIAIAVVGLLVAVVMAMLDDDGGYMGFGGSGCFGILICGACWLLAAGLALGRLLA
jgi:hypothetical protein